MKKSRTIEAVSLGATALALLGASPAGAQTVPSPASSAPVAASAPAQSDPATTAGRAAAAASPGVTGDRSVGRVPSVVGSTSGGVLSAARAGCLSSKGFGAGVNAYFCKTARSYLPTMSAWTRSEIPDDYAKNDSPGIATTTVRVYGTNWLQTENGANASSIVHTDEMTCTGLALTGVSISGGGASASSGATSASSSRTATINNSWFHQFFYNQDAHWRCKASNLSPAKVTRRSTGSVNYKNGTTTPVAEYSFWY